MCESAGRLLPRVALVFAFGQTAQPAPEQQQRIRALEQSLLAPCCYSEVVATHNSEVAASMRKEIAAWVVAGKTDREILDSYPAKYGQRGFTEPEGALRWWTNVVPWVALVFGGLAVALLIQKSRQAAEAEEATRSTATRT